MRGGWRSMGRESSSNGSRIDDRDRQALEVIGVECQNSRDAKGLHGSDQASVMRFEPLDAERLDESMPAVNQIRVVGEKFEPPLKVDQPEARLIGGHAEAVLTRGRHTRFARGHRPELVEILRNDDE